MLKISPVRNLNRHSSPTPCKTSFGGNLQKEFYSTLFRNAFGGVQREISVKGVPSSFTLVHDSWPIGDTHLLIVPKMPCFSLFEAFKKGLFEETKRSTELLIKVLQQNFKHKSIIYFENGTNPLYAMKKSAKTSVNQAHAHILVAPKHVGFETLDRAAKMLDQHSDAIIVKHQGIFPEKYSQAKFSYNHLAIINGEEAKGMVLSQIHDGKKAPSQGLRKFFTREFYGDCPSWFWNWKEAGRIFSNPFGGAKNPPISAEFIENAMARKARITEFNRAIQA